MTVAPPDLWSQIVDWGNLHAAYLDARKGKRYRAEVAQYSATLEQHLFEVQAQLVHGVWAPSPPRVFRITDPKPRDITAPPFGDRVVHHALVRQINPLIERRFVRHSYACRKGKGVQAAVATLQKLIRIEQRNSGDVWALKADIARYFASIDHGRLLGLIERCIGDGPALNLCRRILAGYGFDAGRGLPVGALTSQLFANLYLDHMDHRLKDDFGIKSYVRYMDDFIVLGHSKSDLWRLCDHIADLLAGDLRLRLNRKTSVIQARRGIDFCGYRVFATHILPRKRNVKRAKQRIVKAVDQYNLGLTDFHHSVKPAVDSFIGYAKHCNCHKTTEKVLGELVMRPTVRHRETSYVRS